MKPLDILSYHDIIIGIVDYEDEVFNGINPNKIDRIMDYHNFFKAIQANDVSMDRIFLSCKFDFDKVYGNLSTHEDCIDEILELLQSIYYNFVEDISAQIVKELCTTKVALYENNKLFLCDGYDSYVLIDTYNSHTHQISISNDEATSSFQLIGLEKKFYGFIGHKIKKLLGAK